MHKARLVKKETLQQETVVRKRKGNKPRKHQAPIARTAVEVTTEWLKGARQERPGAREAFAALFAEPDPQSA